MNRLWGVSPWLIFAPALLLALGCQGSMEIEGEGQLDPSHGSNAREEIPGKNNGEGLNDDPSNPKNLPDDPEGPPGLGEEEDPNLIPGDQLFSCQADQVLSSPGVVRRLGPGELRDRWDRDPPPAPYAYDPTLRYTSYYSRDILDESSAGQMVDVALALAKNFVRDKKPHGYPECFWKEEKPVDEACVESLMRNLLNDSFLRPASQEEIDRFVAFGVESLSNFSEEQARQVMVAAVYASPPSIYRSELGQGEPDAEGRRRLGDWEIAQAISYALKGTHLGHGPASHALRNAAEEGKLSSDEEVEKMVRLLFENPNKDEVQQMPEGVRRFFRQWLGFGDPEDVFKSEGPKLSYAPGYYDGQTESLLNIILRNDSDVLAHILTTRQAKLFGDKNGEASDRNEVYNYDQPLGDGGNLVELPSHQRAGLLTQPSWLAAQSRNVYSEPHAVYRGYWVRKNLLCGHVPALPITADAVLPEDTDKTVRQRLEIATEPSEGMDDSRQYCWGCHKLMNPLGVPFEIYDHRGQWREEEQLFREGADGKMEEFYAPVDARSTLLHTGDPMLDGKEVADATEMMELMSQSVVVEQCFVRQTFRYFMGRPERPEDSCTLASMYDAYKQNGGSFYEMLAALFTSETFLYRVQASQEMQP